MSNITGGEMSELRSQIKYEAYNIIENGGSDKRFNNLLDQYTARAVLDARINELKKHSEVTGYIDMMTGEVNDRIAALTEERKKLG